MLEEKLYDSSEALPRFLAGFVSQVLPTLTSSSSHIYGMRLLVCWQVDPSESSRDGQDGV